MRAGRTLGTSRDLRARRAAIDYAKRPATVLLARYHDCAIDAAGARAEGLAPVSTSCPPAPWTIAAGGPSPGPGSAPHTPISSRRSPRVELPLAQRLRRQQRQALDAVEVAVEDARGRGVGAPTARTIAASRDKRHRVPARAAGWRRRQRADSAKSSRRKARVRVERAGARASSARVPPRATARPGRLQRPRPHRPATREPRCTRPLPGCADRRAQLQRARPADRPDAASRRARSSVIEELDGVLRADPHA